MKESLYSRRSNLIIGFHGCDQTVVDKVLAGEEKLLASTNDYDWLGNEMTISLGLSFVPAVASNQRSSKRFSPTFCHFLQTNRSLFQKDFVYLHPKRFN